MFDKVLIANRGVAAVRIERTLRRLGVQSVGLRSSAEADATYFSAMDEVFDLGDGPLADTYLNASRIVDAAVETGVQAIHPGYGFLSENADFAEAVADAGLTFVGPSPATIRAFGFKHRAREIARQAGVEMLPGSELLADPDAAVAAAEELGFPVILKSTAGGGGIGMQRCDSVEELSRAYSTVRDLAAANFAAPDMFLEKFLVAPRHVEVQIFGDGCGGVVVLGDRDCSLQRRNQKLVEECPAPAVPDEVRSQLHAQAAALARATDYASAGTVEFLYDAVENRFYFLEVNTRLQVEHGVTELVYGVDLVEWMLQLAAGELPSAHLLAESLTPHGAAIQARLYAEDPYHDFRPTPGPVDIDYRTETRVDTWVLGSELVPHQFDPLLANVICHADDRSAAMVKLRRTLAQADIYGIATNRMYLAEALAGQAFADASMSTAMLGSLVYEPDEVEVVSAGLQTTIQAFPGRQGYWEVGVPPSGPMDDLSFRLANRLLGNAEDAAGLEIVFEGPTLLFRSAVDAVVTGADVPVLLDGQPVAAWQVLRVQAGQRLDIGRVENGMRCYLQVRGGFDAKTVLGSVTTFTLGNMGGHEGRQLRTGDVLRWRAADPVDAAAPAKLDISARLKIRVLPGPHTAPDFFTPEDIQQIFAARWRVHHNSSRTGVRLIGPQPVWAREDGGEAGLHPSNIHDNAYAFGALDFTGDMPVILGPDGPSLGGFVCPAVVINADRWKLGQLQPGDEVDLVCVSAAEAEAALAEQEAYLANPAGGLIETSGEGASPLASPVCWQSTQQELDLPVVVRRAGQEWLLIEFGAPVLDIRIRVVVHVLMKLLMDERLEGLVEMTPGVRSLQVRFDHRRWSTQTLIEALRPCIEEATRARSHTLSSRIVHMPLSWDDPACQLAVERYLSSVRADAPWCPDNIEFIRRINGLDEKADVKRIVFDASYLVLGLGDVYLGAPVATPVDPRHRLVTTKYNPARTWTAENSVGIGGSYMCVYGMEGPGGYQFVGRTTPVWRLEGFSADEQACWLLNHFDQIRFHEVDPQTLMELREATRRGAYVPDVEECSFSLDGYEELLRDNANEIEAFSARRTAAFAAELQRWRELGLHTFAEAAESEAPETEPVDGYVVASPMAASVWRINSSASRGVDAESEILLLEAMKSEISVLSPVSGCVEFLVKEGQVVEPGQALAVVR